MQSKQIVFLDVATPRAYSTVEDAPGGTEMSVVRVAHGLAKRGHEVHVAQRGRAVPMVSYVQVDGPSIRYEPIRSEWVPESPDLLVVLRRPEAVAPSVRFCRSRRTVLWCHDFNQADVFRYRQDVERHNVRVVGVSSHHAEAIKSAGVEEKYVEYIYLPLDERAVPSKSATWYSYNPYGLLFACSPHKGLDRALNVFRRLRQLVPKFELRILNPGYYETVAVNEPGVRVIGRVDLEDVLREMRGSLCLLHPNDVYPETFGLVNAEANAVGVPVAAYSVGATEEVLGKYPEQLHKPGDVDGLIKSVLQWRLFRRPDVRARPEFSIDSVLDRWEELLA